MIKGALPQVTDGVLLEKMNPPKSKGRPPKNSLLDNYKKQHPDVAALEPPKKQSTAKTNKATGPAVGTAPSVLQPVDSKFVSGPPHASPVPAHGFLSSTPLSHPQNSQNLSAPNPEINHVPSANVGRSPKLSGYAAGTARLNAPPTPTTYPQVVIPDKIPGLDNQEFALISQQAQIREELDKVLEKWPGPAENVPEDPKDEGSRIAGSGWWGDEQHGQVPDWQRQALDIVDRLRKYVDVESALLALFHLDSKLKSPFFLSGSRPCANLEEVPAETNIPYLSFRVSKHVACRSECSSPSYSTSFRFRP